jgi:hypothetical protein
VKLFLGRNLEEQIGKRLIMINTVEEFIRLRDSEKPEEYNRANYDFLPDEVAFEIIEKYPEYKEWVGINSSISLKVLYRLAEDEDPDVRWHIASLHAFTGEKVHTLDRYLLDKLSRDQDESVRQRVAYHPDTPVDILERLTHDLWKNCAEAAREKLAQRLNPSNEE